MSFSPDTQIGPYKILDFLAKGGMGEVYRGEDERLGRNVAIKILPENLILNPDATRRFQQEARALAALSHPNIVTIFDVGIHENTPFVVMELLQGETLRTYIERGTLTQQKILEITVSIAEALRCAHSAGIIHRDLKPQNIFYTSTGIVKILDFGLARWHKTDASVSQEVTSTGVIAGTVAYMSPEQLRGQPLDSRTDIFSFGCILYEMSLGHSPFSRQTAAETISAILHSPAPAPKGISSELSQLILHCLEKDPDQRFQAAQDILLFLRTIQSSKPAKRKAKQAIQSIAILPFDNSSADAQMEYLSDGITEALINSLSQLTRLKVMARGTVFNYRGKQTDPLEVGRQLNVGAVLTGRVIQQGDQLLIGTELMDVQNGWHLWGEQYNRKTADVFALQSDIVAEISSKLRLKLSTKERHLLAKHYTKNTDAYQAYLKGRYFWNRRTGESFQKAIEHFTQAIQIDPLYALAYAGLSDTYALLADFGILLPPQEAFAKSRSAVNRALEIDPSLAEAHTSLGHLKTHEFRWDEAVKEYKEALRLNPGYATAHHWYFMCLTMIGRFEDSLEEMKKAEELDPLSLIIQTDIAACYYFNNNFESAIHRLKKVQDMDPNFASAHRFLSAVYEQLGKFREAIQEFEKARISAGKDASEVAAQVGELRRAYEESGAQGYWNKRLEHSKKQSQASYVSPYNLAQICASSGDKEKAIQLLEEAYQEPSASLVYLKVDPRFTELRSDPRFRNLLNRIGL
ncbi:protein kinase [bacterium]|nr:protein kinase [bacterium]